MVKYVDSGEGPDSSSKKKKRMGFKVDRRANYEKIMQKKMGKDTKKSSSSSPSAPKSVVFNEASLKEYVTSLHKNKNERRVKAFVDMKRKIKKDNSKVRREQREEARRAYNKYAKIPILPNYTFNLPKASFDNEEEEEENEEDEKEERMDEEEKRGEKKKLDPLDEVLQPLLKRNSTMRRTALQGITRHVMPLSMGASTPDQVHVDHNDNRDNNNDHVVDGKGKGKKHKSGNKQQSTENGETQENAEEEKAQGITTEISLPPKPKINTLESFYAEAKAPLPPPQAVLVEVRPLLERTRSGLDEQDSSSSARSSLLHNNTRARASTASSLPSVDFSDLPAVVEEALSRLRRETKGPSRTKARIATLKELEKIRKIRKHSRKGHGKKSAAGKRKNRSK